ncbi:ABC-2 type transport system permease protein [Antricoccus suffuscus]|uniref:ABC-2 type transport system permease protein n=1 Tax=Antricoccus suffuscus TaxID=1629062 RepID=A0A2T0ZYG6_9ACTN|nr:ABC transporter permease [Antricoccus suffuscus]PRZ41287.1 ABC-2 type transport system permease protein [Antricoccus suffuscus]
MTTLAATTSITQQSHPAAAPASQIIKSRIRSHVIETLRIPIAVVSGVAFPVMSFLFFVIPQSAITSDQLFSLGAIAQLSVFSIMSTFLFTYGVGIAEDRKNPWTSYLRTLPTGGVATIAGRICTAALFAVLSLIPLLLVGILLTAAPDAFTSGALSWWRIPAAFGALILGGTPFIGLGLAIGYGLPSKAAIAVAQVLLLPLAFIGGLFLPSEMFPGWLNAISLGTPTRAARDLVISALTGADLHVSTIPVLVVWSAALLGLALWGYRRDEGLRYK